MAIEGVVFQHRGIDHEDDRRSLATAFNGDFNGFTAQQVKRYYQHKEALLAGHFHKYAELFWVIHGEIKFLLEDTRTKEKEEYTVREMETLLIPAYVAHKVFPKAGSEFIGCTEKPYVSSQVNDNKYDF